MWDLVPIREAAKLLKVHPETLRRHETRDGQWCEILGVRLRVYRLSDSPTGQRRYDRAEILRLMARLQRGRLTPGHRSWLEGRARPGAGAYPTPAPGYHKMTQLFSSSQPSGPGLNDGQGGARKVL